MYAADFWGTGRKGFARGFRKRRGAARAALLIIFTLICLLAGLFLWFTFRHYRSIRRGEDVRLPQFTSQFTLWNNAGEASPAPSADRAFLETRDDPALGPAPDAAKLVIVEFVDYECPFCKSISGVVRQAAAKYPDEVRFIVRDFPVLELHPNALLVAEAAGCAEAQGRFWPMHDRILAANETLNLAALERLAVQSGAEAAAWKTCMNQHLRAADIEEDAAAGVATGVRGTPTFFFNGERVEGAIPEATLDTLIQAFLKRTP